MWYDVLKALKEACKGIADEIHIGGYAPNSIRPKNRGKGCIYILRDKEVPSNDDLVQEEEIHLFLDGWIRCDDTNPENGYRLIYDLEQRIEQALEHMKETVDYIAPDVQLLQLVVNEKMGDGDSIRPLLGVRYSITVEIYRR